MGQNTGNILMTTDDAKEYSQQLSASTEPLGTASCVPAGDTNHDINRLCQDYFDDFSHSHVAYYATAIEDARGIEDIDSQLSSLDSQITNQM